MKTTTAQVHFNDSGTPVADHFDDVYFSNDSGIDETRHVFMSGNDLPERWHTHTGESFVIAETGFGTGLNFLVAMQAFHEFRQANPQHVLKRLYFLSTEKFPLAQKDMQHALLRFTALEHEATALATQYPIAMEGCHRMNFANYGVTLDLWMGDVHALLPQWHAPRRGLVDAWFLDGFAPSKNPDMWTAQLFSEMARLSVEGCTFGTFTAAGVVKRGLKEAGFAIQKRPGFGRKRDMLTGQYHRDAPSAPSSPPYYRFAADAVNSESHVVVVGGGLAGAAVTHALASRGIRTTVLVADEQVAQGASGNPQGGFYPQLHSEASHASQIQAHTFLYANRLYRGLAEQSSLRHEFCGVMLLGFNAAQQARQHKLITQQVWPEALIHGLDATEADTRAGVTVNSDALFVPLGGWLSPPDVVAGLFEQAAHLAPTVILTGHKVSGVVSDERHVQVHCVNGETVTADHVIMATGAESITSALFEPLALRPVRGQVEAVPTQSPLDQLQTVLCHKGYLTPACDGRHALGSTYIKNDTDTRPRAEESTQNLATHQQAMANCDWMEHLQHDGTARAAVRLGVADHQPLVGALGELDTHREHYASLASGKRVETAPLPPASRVSALTALGSRGLTTAPLLAELLASQLCHDPLPLPEPLLQALNPNRFIVRDCIRGKC
ncbi:bifunctional tRNA (5-methylaminomethyl-2-thiouridine)(34)-methyltransferase MnmD/FAD-dependent 5-carboxymethylaminomethyl-2-thiouridine(34) oxidoreductase MnmC [Alteromonas sp. ASW11-19]|uniref:tRNA 5-methylaminomethyl-2-thiouridine biosynthesis bifunctional protein MnmC n=1 Tax=Alteromonas salexigens TaxID=2982530 RepID=A0ABT2VRK3_9ALTE|nr:bifunctional tRNA (5-methylaminomethyl-2-thiouridine)(34)-methyltransferase MnmD/FAD-dependent 5-carboxymethylaminomethyl-2-thiouridine(34) oxidoreductase MnmC [Alteromonas salexigens]MCU7555940.1 bifunctional tRNA (5-methylaminomethyl-2-thiouridine)(34)-methyltransferase MnmD/FAD-dependent 5-carboxymethylaminomethyl-2-thiouridine(34) oxidoreductase MnmC [Alteromonas salexigens]